MLRRAFVPFALAIMCMTGALQAAEPDVRAISRLGFTSVGSGPYLMFGTDVVDQPQDGHTLQMRLTNLQSPGTLEDAIKIELSSEWSRYTLLGMYQLGGTLSWSQRGADTARSVGLFGEGVLGRIQGSLSASYQEPSFDKFAWNVDPDSELVSGIDGGYRLNADVRARISPGLDWGQQIMWNQPLDTDRSGLLVTTGPQLPLGNGHIAAGAGVIVRRSKMESIGTLSYTVDLSERSGWNVAAGTSSLWQDVPFLEAGYRYATPGWSVGTVCRFDYSPGGTFEPTFFFSFQPNL